VLRASWSQHPLIRAFVALLMTVTVTMLLAGSALGRIGLARRAALTQSVGSNRTPSLTKSGAGVAGQSQDKSARTTSRTVAEEEEEREEEEDLEDEGGGTAFDGYFGVLVNHTVHPPSWVTWREADDEVRLTAPSLEPVFPPPRCA